MRIGVLTFYNVANFGANLQALSTYRYLQKKGHDPLFINYNSKEEAELHQKKMLDVQYKTHIDFVKKYIERQTEECLSIDDVESVIEKYNIDGIFVGSDAVLQHHPLLARIKASKSKLLFVQRFYENRNFPNPYWGINYSHRIPTAFFSVSSQNSEYGLIAPWLRMKMSQSLKRVKYISVRDSWTQKMVKHISGKDVDITPDPVFAYNFNAPDTVLSLKELKGKFNLPDKYLLISLRDQSLPENVLNQIKEMFASKGISCVAMTMPSGVKFTHHFDYEIAPPLKPNEWFSLIKNAYGYVGSNMHPIIVSLHNAVPCVSIDNWGRKNFFNKKIDDGSSKVEHIMKEFNVDSNHFMIKHKICPITAKEIFECIESFPIENVKKHAMIMYERYKKAMDEALDSLQCS